MLKGFGARQLQRHCWSGFAIGASHSFPAAEQRVQAGQRFETAEAFRAGTVLSSKAGESKHQSKVSQSRACFGSSVVKVGNVNVRTLAREEAHAGKAEFLAEKLSRLSLALCGLCEVRWPRQGQKQVGAYSVHYSGGTTKHHGVALALSQTASQCLQGCSPISDRIITTTFHTALTPLTVIQVYAPT